jgi:F-type H+-transporting ATPase subunit b
MLIDWFTVCAQAINFLILVWLLKRLLYKPVLAAIDAREKKIAAQLADAAATKERAQTEREEFRHRNESFDQERETLLRKAANEATAERLRLMESARQDSQQLRTKLAEALATERAELNLRFLTQTQEELFALAGKVLADLAGVGLEDRMIEVFVARVRELRQHQPQTTTAPAVTTAPGPDAQNALVRSAFELSAAGRADIALAVRECFGPNVNLRYESSPGLVCGVELTVEGVKFAWSIGDYLTALSRHVAELIASPPALGPAKEATSVPAAPVAQKEALHGH